MGVYYAGHREGPTAFIEAEAAKYEQIYRDGRIEVD